MVQNIYKYFSAEKSESLLFIILGLAAIALTILFFLAYKSRFTTGIAIPFLLIGLLQITVGSTVYLRTDDQVFKLLKILNANPHKYKSDELMRMERVNKSFDVYKIIEIGLALIAVALIIFTFYKKQKLLLGLGIGLLFQSCLMLAADLVAEKRADKYTELVKNCN